MVKIFDSTLRDGEQAPENTMSPEQKLAIALQLEKLGVDTIEAGFPASSREDSYIVYSIARRLQNSKICAFARSLKCDIDIAGYSLRHAQNGQIQILGSGSDINLYKRGITREDGLKDSRNSIKYAITMFPKLEISFAMEDSSRGDINYLADLTKTAVDSGAKVVVLADTVGYTYPTQFSKLVRSIKQVIPDSVSLSVHCHNDLGLAVANTLAGIENGATEAQVTLGGIGERCGNAQLEALVMALYLHPELGKTSVNTSLFYETSQLLKGILNRDFAYETPIVGKNAFTTEAGMHQHGILKNSVVYQAFNPKIVGRKQEFYLGRHSGKYGFEYKLKELGIIPSDQEVVNIMERAKKKGEFSDKDLIKIAGEAKNE